jgi:DNA-binding GntR family transcriptional regulator
MTRTLARRLLADRAYDALKESLLSGKYPPGTFLSERQLARGLGMSKTPLKSALVRLEAEGFLRISPQQGIVVREPSAQEIVELFDLREAIESYVVQRIAGRLTPDQAARLKENVRQQERAVREDKVVDATRLDTEFHMLVCGFLGNREMLKTLARMREKLHLHILGNLTRRPERTADSTREHAGIAEALLQGKGARAAELVRRHLDYGRNFVLGQDPNRE